MDENNIYGKGYDSMPEGINTITLQDSKIIGHGIQMIVDALTLNSSSITSDTYLDITGGRTGRPGKDQSTQDENSYKPYKYASITLNDDSLLESSNIFIYLTYLSNNRKSEDDPNIKGDLISLNIEQDKIINFPRGTKNSPAILADEINFMGSGTIIFDNYSVKARNIGVDDSIKLISINSTKGPHIFGVESYSSTIWPYDQVILDIHIDKEFIPIEFEISELQILINNYNLEIVVTDKNYQEASDILSEFYKNVISTDYNDLLNIAEQAMSDLTSRITAKNYILLRDYGTKISDDGLERLFLAVEQKKIEVVLHSTDGTKELVAYRIGAVDIPDENGNIITNKGQCVTLVKQLIPELRLIDNFYSAKEFLDTYKVLDEKTTNKEVQFTISKIPTVGSVFVQDIYKNDDKTPPGRISNGYGHTGIVIDSKFDPEKGTYTITLLEQNFQEAGTISSYAFIGENKEFSDDFKGVKFKEEDSHGGLGIITKTRTIEIDPIAGKQVNGKDPLEFKFITTDSTDKYGLPSINRDILDQVETKLLNLDIYKYRDGSNSTEIFNQKAILDEYILHIDNKEDWDSVMDAFLAVSNVYHETAAKAPDIEPLLTHVDNYLKMSTVEAKQQYLISVAYIIEAFKKSLKN
jgi:hypothetical protein